LTRKKCIDGASGAVDILQNAKVFDSLEEIFNQDNKRSSCSCSSSSTGEGKSKLIVCGTGMPLDMSRERPMQKYVAPRKYFKELLSTTTVSAPDHDCCESLNIAFVFGNERTGMTFSDMDMCDVMLGIPTNPSFGSLNLASAVQIIAYDWREAMGGFPLIDDNFKS
jgi:tRNA/rRNA methyltransferase